MLDLRDLLNSPVDSVTKGMPSDLAPIPLARIGEMGWNVLNEDLPLPLAVLRQSAIDHNSAWMRRFLDLTGAHLCPHGKTSMSPQLFSRQLADGAWGITCSTPNQLACLCRFGVRRILLANQVVGRMNCRIVASECARLPDLDLYVLADSVTGVRLLANALRDHDVRQSVKVLIEIGGRELRTGVRDTDGALIVAREVAANAPHLTLAGVEGYEGLLSGATAADAERNVRRFLDRLLDAHRALVAAGLLERAEKPIISAGGSEYFDLVIDAAHAAELNESVDILLRSGCYLSHDAVHYSAGFQRMLMRNPQYAALGEGLRPALEVWAYVQSVPEPLRAYATIGKRDISHDWDLPVPMRWFRPGVHRSPLELPPDYKVIALNDQHAHLAVPDKSVLQTGDMICFGISHPCTTFDKWRVICVVDDDYNVVEAIRTFF